MEEEKPKAVVQKYALGHGVYSWPEFKAFAKRLMIDWDAATSCITIKIPDGDNHVEILHEYYGLDDQNKR